MKADGTLLVGTRGSDVLEVSAQGALIRKVVQGHYKGVRDFPEVWGCAAHPTEQLFATSGADMSVRLW
jgi:WD40 repeat protein